MTNHWDEEDWIKNMRRPNNAFNLLRNTLRLHIPMEDTRFRKCVSAEIKLAATLFCLNGESDYMTVVNTQFVNR